MKRPSTRAARMIDDTSHGHDWSWWLKLAGISASAGALLFGMVSGFMRIDQRLEAHGERLDALVKSVQLITDRATTHQVVDEKLEKLCLQMAIANNGRFICPFAPATAKRPAPKAPAKG